MAFCPAIVRLNGSNGSGHEIVARFIGMAVRGFIEDVGPAVGSARAGHRPRLGTSGTAVDELRSSAGRARRRVTRRQFT